jgi:hypothetical protein
MLHALFSLAALGVLAAVALVAAIWRAFFTRLASVPGPFAARFTDLWYAYRLYRGGFEKDNLQLHKKYGTPAMEELVVNSYYLSLAYSN